MRDDLCMGPSYNPNIPKFIQLLTSDNKELNINIAMFVKKSFELRKTYNCYYN